MSRNLQRELDFGDTQETCSLVPPKGYKGLAGFHKYWGKKPTEAWRFLIENLTFKGEVVLDPFLGSGLIAKECTDLDRRFVGFDVNPISIELTKLYIEPPNYLELKAAISRIEEGTKETINEMYRLSNGSVATHFLWSEDLITKIWSKTGRKRIEQNISKAEICKLQNPSPYNIKNTRAIRLFDNSRINSKKSFTLNDLFTPRALRAIDLIINEINNFDGRTKRALLLILSSSLGQMSRMVFAVTKRGKTKGKEVENIEVGSWVIGYWRPDQHFEVNSWNCFENKARKLLKAVKEAEGTNNSLNVTSLEHLLSSSEGAYVRVGDSENLLKDIPSSSIKVVLTDPPHGDRIPYLELSEMWNGVLGLESNFSEELVVSNAKDREKCVSTYNSKLSKIFTECSRVLTENGIMAVMFNARSNDHWDSLNELEMVAGLEYIGCYPMEYSAGSVVQDNRKGGLKTDYVLLYGKRMNGLQKKTLESAFLKINGWSADHPKKV